MTTAGRTTAAAWVKGSYIEVGRPRWAADQPELTAELTSGDLIDLCLCLFVCLLLAATRTNNTVCAPCEDGTYSNVTDFHSPCLRHTRSVGVWCVSVHSVCPSTSAFWGTQCSCSDRARLLMSQSLVICPKVRSHAHTHAHERAHEHRKFIVGVNRPHSRIVNICSGAFSLCQHSILMCIFFILIFLLY